MDSPRIVITGIGLLTSVGNSVSETWKNLLNGKSGIGPITKFDTEGFRSKIAGEIRNFDIQNFIPPKEARRLDPFCHYAIAATAEAIDCSNLISDREDLTRIGVLIGSGIGGIHTLETQYEKYLAGGPSKVSPFLVPMMIGDMAAGVVAIKYGFQGPNFGIVSACATGCHAIGEAYSLIKRGDADVMVAGGTEACITPSSCAGFSAMKALSSRNDEPERASRPFDAERDGFVLAEGAGVVILETLDHARDRDATILAEMIAYSATADAYHITSPAPDNRGAVRAIERVMTNTNLQGRTIDYINAHGTGTSLNDKGETYAIKQAFGADAYGIAISSTKSLTGHTLGAAGAIESIVCIKAVNEDIIPGTYNYENKDPECDLYYVPNQSIAKNVRTALNLNFGFGGHNAVIAWAKYEN